MKRTFIIYKITNLINGKIYIWQTTRALKERIKEHRSSKDTCIGQAIHKYGWENFQARIIDECKTIDELNEREIFWIAKYNTIAPKGYNLTEGGKNCIFSDVAKLKISIANKGRKRTKETCKRISEVKKGTRLSAEAKAKMSAKRKGRPLSEATRAKMTLAQAKKSKESSLYRNWRNF